MEEHPDLATDTSYEDRVIVEVQRDASGDCILTLEERGSSDLSGSLHYDFNPGDLPWPKPGEVARFYFTPGRLVRGLAVGGRLYFYRSPLEAEAAHIALLFGLDDEARQLMPDMEAHIAALPQSLKWWLEQMTQTHAGSSDFKKVVLVRMAEEAAHLAEVYPAKQELERFATLPQDQKLEQQPWLRQSGHSEGSLETMSQVCELALWLLDQQ